MKDCIFCKIARREIAVDIVVENENGLVFHDANPVAPVHLLVIPRNHHLDAGSAIDNESLFGHLIALAARAAQVKGIDASGYRIITNSGPDAGQGVPHVHFHVLGGRVMGWPPG